MLEKVPDFEKKAKQLIIIMPQIAEKEMFKFVMGNFERQGFLDATVMPWMERKNGDDPGRAILTKSGSLRDSIKITESSIQRVVLGSNAKHAKIHNEGGIINIPVTPKMRKFFWAKYKETANAKYKGMALTKKTHFVVNMPKRQFMGDSATFKTSLDTEMIKKIIEVFKAI